MFLNLLLISFCSTCCVLFRDTRSFVLEESLKKLGVEKLSKEDVQRMQWEVLEAKIGNWIHFMRIAVRTLVKDGNNFNMFCSLLTQDILFNRLNYSLLEKDKYVTRYSEASIL